MPQEDPGGTVYRSPMAQPLCADCHTRVNGQISGYMTGGYKGALAGPGILSWMRKAISCDDAK